MTADAASGPAGATVTQDSFDRFYYQNCCDQPYGRSREWLGFFGAIADRIISDIRPTSVLDAGCAFGFLVEALRQRGVQADGIDLSPYAIAQVHPAVAVHCRQGSIAAPLGRSYGLIVSIEVLEHMPARDGERAIENICAHTGDVLFSSSPSDHREPTHVNVQPAEYWAEQFARHGFYRDVDYDASYITPWAVRFCKVDLPLHRVVRGYERRYARLQIERDEAKSYAIQLQRQLARYRMPLSEKLWRLTQRLFGLRR